MDQRRFEADVNVNAKDSGFVEISFVKKAGAVLAAGIISMLAVGAVGVYALMGKSAAEQQKISEIVSTKSVETTASVIASAEDQTSAVSQPVEQTASKAAQTWKKARIDEYDLVIETVKATEKKVQKKTKKQTEEQVETTAATQEVKQAEVLPVETEAAEDKKQAEEVTTCAVKTMYTDGKVNMRKEPSLDGELIKVLDENSEVTVTGYTNDWYRIKIDGESGYSMKKYLTEAAPEQPEQADTAADTAVIPCTDAEFEMLCYVLQGEVGDCSEDSKIAVANVIINRVKSDSFPNSIEGVLTQPDQFTAIYGYYGGYNVPTENTRECARRAIAGEDNSNGAVYYYAPNYCGGSTAAWFESLTFCTAIDGQRYFK